MNADRRRRFGTAGRTIALLCECDDPECRRTVLLTTEDYDARPAGPLLHPEHLIAEHLMPGAVSSPPPPGAEIPSA